MAGALGVHVEDSILNDEIAIELGSEEVGVDDSAFWKLTELRALVEKLVVKGRVWL